MSNVSAHYSPTCAMKLLSLTILTAVLATLLVAHEARGQTYELAGKAQKMTWPNGNWDGKHSFAGVYCVTFPVPGTAIDLTHAMFNRGAIYLTSVLYPENLSANIVVSTVPQGRTVEEEISRMLANERRAEGAYAHSYGITELETAFGPSIGLRIKNVADRARNGPFPLVRPIYKPAKEPIESLSVHRLFVRGPDRFEVAVLQLAKQPADESTESEMSARITAFADEVVKSLQSCTAALPPRTPR